MSKENIPARRHWREKVSPNFTLKAPDWLNWIALPEARHPSPGALYPDPSSLNSAREQIPFDLRFPLSYRVPARWSRRQRAVLPALLDKTVDLDRAVRYITAAAP
ncbi:hypothetical protein ABTX35_37175 [Streptomyces sp. NPDC096080]|uniref:hypothetical protein n=1 Tax=Streptomyces sp. NPDC096080 TaxID=3156693 RepID=UPI00332DCD51